MFREKWPDIYKETIRKGITDKEYKKLSRFVNLSYGIKLPQSKKVMVQSRLLKRLRELQLESYSEYLEYVFSDSGNNGEMIHMIDAITTNKTEFFREPVHFEFLNRFIIPEFLGQSNSKRLKIWSAACSSGEEPYSIAFCLEESMTSHGLKDYYLLGTDLSTRILKMAVNAVYTEQRIEEIPEPIRKKYLLRSKDPAKKLYKVVPVIRNKIHYKHLNLMDKSYSVDDSFDIIFCRNVLIYFDREVQEQVINKLCRYLRPGGYFLLGHSESIMQMDVPLNQIKPTIFRKK